MESPILKVQKTSVTCPAKINLTLDILGCRDDGYHEVEMVMQSIGLCDTITVSLFNDTSSDTAGGECVKPKIKLTVDEPTLPCDENNLAYKAARLFLERYKPAIPTNCGIAIEIKKSIPIAAGLAGGSTDAAGVLRALNELFNLNIPLTELADLGAAIGSDVPFCVLGGTMLSKGRGEVLQRLPDLPVCSVVTAKPPVDVSTAWAYKTFDKFAARQKDFQRPDTTAFLGILNDAGLADAAKLERLAALLNNVFEYIIAEACPEILQYKKLMEENGALKALLSGSGPTVFCLVKDESTAAKIAAALRSETKANIAVSSTVPQN